MALACSAITISVEAAPGRRYGESREVLAASQTRLAIAH